MSIIEVRTRAELVKALKAAKAYDEIALRGDGYFEIDKRPASGSASVWAYDSASVWAYGSASVWAYGSASVWAYDSASVTASGSASVTAYDSASVWAYDSASVRAYDSASVWAYGSASVTASGSASVTAYDSASVWAYDSASVWAYDSASVWAYDSASVRAYDSASVWAYDSASVWASKYVAVHLFAPLDKNVKVQGGVVIRTPKIITADDWIDYHGVEQEDDSIVVYKALDDDYSTRYARSKGITYSPDQKKVTAKDWRKTKACGNGLHACASPHEALAYNTDAKRFVALRAKVSEIVVIDASKIKAPRLYGPIVEVDIHGRPVAS